MHVILLILLFITAAPPASRQALDKQIAARFAPIFHQGLGENPRADYITNFDFDGDWRGDNNWNNLDNRAFPLKAYIYYSVAETRTHYFIHYAVFHPRDYKGDGGAATSTLLETLIGEGLRRAGKDPTGGLADEVALSHENDLEGCLVVAEKAGNDPRKATVKFVETLAHNRYLKYCAREDRAGLCEAIEMNGQRPLIFIEPKGHGLSRHVGDKFQLKRAVKGVMTYTYAGRAEDSGEAADKSAKSTGYDLIPIYDTLWTRAQPGVNETYGEAFDFQSRSILQAQTDKSAPKKVEQKFGPLGAAFRGTIGFKNKARPPWGWFDSSEKDRPQGEWFFDPAAVVARHFNLEVEFTLVYVYQPYFKIGL
ncbi:MAG: hypothetical protein ACREEM_19280 [Blastocatellia bacterium]